MKLGHHPLNLAFRFLLELGILGGLVYYGWTQFEGFGRILAFVLPVVAAVLWGFFRVPGDPGDAPVAIPGPLRLILELALFGAAVVALYAAQQPTAGLIFGALVILHYALSVDRIMWLLTGQREA